MFGPCFSCHPRQCKQQPKYPREILPKTEVYTSAARTVDKLKPVALISVKGVVAHLSVCYKKDYVKTSGNDKQATDPDLLEKR